MIKLGYEAWGTSPAIPITFLYEKRRSETSMQYRVQVIVSPISGDHYFGYPIYLKLTIAGTLRATVTLKSATPSTWTSAITYTSSWYTVADKTSGTTPVIFNVYSGSGSTRDTSYSYSMAVDPPGGSTFSVSNGTLGTAQTITITPAVSTYKHKMYCICGDSIVLPDGSTDGSFSGTSVTVTAPLSFASNNVTGTTVPVTFRLHTYSSDGATLIGTKELIVTYTIPASVKPVCHLVVSDPTGYLDTYGGYVQGKSTMEIVVSATLAYGSAIQSKAISADGKRYTANVTTTAIRSAEDFDVVATVKDGRSRTSDAASVTIPVLPYTAPVFSSCSVHRCNEDGTENITGSYVKVTYSYAISPLNNKNTLGLGLWYKKTSETDYEAVQLTSNGEYSGENDYYVFPADDASSYDVRLMVWDAFTQTVINTSVSTAEVLMHIRADGTGMAFGKISEKANGFEFGKPIYDRFGTEIGNGLAAYTGSGDAGIDPDTTTESLILTMVNTPISGQFMYIQTVFYSGKSATANRAQIAIPYKISGSMYHRYYVSGAWSDWERHVNASDIVDLVYPVGSYYIANNSTNPQTLFGGTWYRVEGRFLYGCASSGTPGATGSYTAGSGSSTLPYVNVAIWRRTA